MPHDDGRVLIGSTITGFPAWTNKLVGLFAVALGGAVGAQRHIFTSPGLAAVAVAIAVLPWLVCSTRYGVSVMERWPYLTSFFWTAIVLSAVLWLLVNTPQKADFAPFFLVLLVGEISSTLSPRLGAATAATCGAGMVALWSAGHYDNSVVIWIFAIAVTWMGASGFRLQAQATNKLAAAQEELAARAVEEERHRLARDVHDLIAHTLAVTMLHMTGARLALKDGDTTEALEALVDAENAGRSAMAEIHRTVGLLGTADSNGSQAPTPSALDVCDLVRAFASAGLDVDFELRGDLASVPLGTGLASYRIVQESLSNAVKHAPGAPVHLRIDVTDAQICIDVENPLPEEAEAEPGFGHGLRGMTERAELLGGTTRATSGAGTWTVAAVIPWARVPA
jgi:signal transduction histidine kinase